MESYLISSHYDIITPDGYIEKIEKIDQKTSIAHVIIKNISPAFRGFFLPSENIFFNLKSTLAQLGINSTSFSFFLDKKNKRCEVKITLKALTPLSEKILEKLPKGSYIGKLFAKDKKRIVREPYYLMRMFGRCDKNGSPLLSLGGPKGRDDLILEKIDGQTIAFLPLKKGVIKYNDKINGLIPTLLEMLQHKKFKIRELLKLNQIFVEDEKREVKLNDMLLVKTTPLHIRTVFAKVADHLLPSGISHTSAFLLQPDTEASGNIYELYGSSEKDLSYIPLEFYTLEPHREYVFFSDRDQLQSSLENPEILFKTFSKAPKKDLLSSVFIVKGTQMENLSNDDWIKRKANKHDFPGITHPSRQIVLVEKYIKEQPSYPFLKAIENGLISSEGILLNRYFPSPLLKKMFLSSSIQRAIKGIYFLKPSRSHDMFFSNEDRAFLLDLYKFSIPVFWVDESTKKILRFIIRDEKDTGMFVPIDLIDTFRKACFLGVYGSNLKKGNFSKELKDLLQGIQSIKKNIKHPILCKDTPLALVTGGGPGVMELGNKIAKELNILSCANIIDFSGKKFINEQKINPYIDAKMTFRLNRLVERQAEFLLDLPIFLQGGIGTDFEFTLEEVRRKVAATPITPILLFGEKSYFEKKITSKFKCNLEYGLIKGSEWTSNCFYCVQTHEQGLKVYEAFLNGKLKIGKNHPIAKNGFISL